MKRKCTKRCVNKKMNYKKDKYFGSKVYAVRGHENAIKAELFKNGPVQASFNVYDDFFKYKRGIYEHKYSKIVSGHSIRVIGYGEERGVKYSQYSRQ